MKILANFMLAPLMAGRLDSIPADVPEERIAALDKDFLDAAGDSHFVARLEELG